MRNQTSAAAAGVRASLGGISAAAGRANRSMAGFGGRLFSDESARRLRDLRASVGKLGASFGRLKSTIASALAPLATVGGIGALAGVGAAVAGGGFFKSVIATGAQFEKYQATLRTLEGSNEKAEKSFDWVKQFAQTTPFEIDKVMESFIRMRAYGMDPMDGSLRTLGDTAAAMGKDVMAAVEMMADAVVGEGERLKEFGLRQSVKGNRITYSGKTKTGEMVKFTANKTDQDDIRRKLIDFFQKYAGQMEVMSKTTGGMLSNISDAWTNFKGEIASGEVGDAVREQLLAILSSIEELKKSGKLKEYAANISSGMAKIIRKIREAAPLVRDFAVRNWPAFKDALSTGWAMFKDVAAAVKQIWGQIRFVVDSLGGWEKALQLLFTAWATWQGLKMAAALGEVATAAGGVVAQFSGWSAAAEAAGAASSAAAGTAAGVAGMSAGAVGLGAAAAGLAGFGIGTAYSNLLENTDQKAIKWRNKQLKKEGWEFGGQRSKNEDEAADERRREANREAGIARSGFKTIEAQREQIKGLRNEGWDRIASPLNMDREELLMKNAGDPTLAKLAAEYVSQQRAPWEGTLKIEVEGEVKSVKQMRRKGKAPRVQIETHKQMRDAVR